MKNNSKVTIFIMSLALILRISFLFIEKNKDISINEINTQQITQNNKKDINNISKINNSKFAQNKEETTIKTNNIEKKTILEDAQKILDESVNDPIKKDHLTETQPIISPIEYDIQNIKFFSQAPLGIRDQPYQDACEEASLLIGQYYLKNKTKTKEEYNKDLLDMVELEMQLLGYFKSTTIMETKQVINKRDPTINAKIIENPSISDLEKEISQNHIIIAPLYGKGLGNPHYALGGPDYHFLVIKGYTIDQFITHDVGTLKGENRYYDKSLIMNNIHDRNRTDVRKGAPRVLVMY